MEFNAKRLTNPQRFVTVFTSWMHSTAPNNSGLTGQWVQGMNTTLGGGGYGASTLKLNAQPSILSNPSLYDYANVEIADGATGHTMDVLGNVRSNADSVQAPSTSLNPTHFQMTTTAIPKSRFWTASPPRMSSVSQSAGHQ